MRKTRKTDEMPTFEFLMMKYLRDIEAMPVKAIEMACLSSLLVTLHPVEFGKALRREWKRRSFTTDLF